MNSETLKLPHRYTATVEIDHSPQNPFAEWEDIPIACFHDRSLYHPGGHKEEPVTLADLFHRIPAGRFRTTKGRAAIASAAGIDLDDVTPPDRGERSPEAWKNALWEALPEQPEGYYCGWSTATAYFEAMEATARLLDIPCHFGTSNGHSQGDSVLVFIAALPEWRERVGAPKNCADQCKTTFDLYTAWAWGDCYGVASITRPDGTELEDGSCWGFYGHDHEKSGLLEHCREAVSYDRTRRAKTAANRRAYIRRERAARLDAACRDIVTV